MNERYEWFLKLRTCKKLGCKNSAVIGEAYCSREHAPLSYWNLEEEPLDEILPVDPHKKFRKQTVQKESAPDDMENWENFGHFDWNEKN